jgi:CRP-like cAMP-binding protein
MTEPGAGNRLLALLSPEDAALLHPLLEPVNLPVRFVLQRPHRPITHAFFPETGLASIVAHGPRGRRIEAGLYGREGMSGLPVVLGSDRTPHETFMQVGGRGQRVEIGPLLEAMDRSRSLLTRILRFAHCQVIQVEQTALANGHAKLEERLARWLLMCHDRMDGDAVPLTHEFLSLMLGVRRAGVTVALAALEARALISVRRGGQVILDRAGLEALAHGSYGVPEAEYRRLLG